MAARDDTVIRGSLITSLILLVLSFALNIFFYLSSDRAIQDAADAKSRLSSVQESVRQNDQKISRLKAMLGRGSLTQDELDSMAKNLADDPDMQAIETKFAANMEMFDAGTDIGSLNYPALLDYLPTLIRQRNDQVIASREQADTASNQAKQDVEDARQAQAKAEQQAAEANANLTQARKGFEEDRKRMDLDKQQAQDKLLIISDNLNKAQLAAAREKQLAQQTSQKLQSTINTQRKQINRMTNTRFETVQGSIMSALPGGDVVTINLGSADGLRPNVTFGVIDRDEIRMEDAKIKANIQVVKVEDAHLSKARVIAKPEIGNPIISGDKIYSPFWAPGRTVKIALAGKIDIDGDDVADNDAIKGQIRAANAEVVAELTETGQRLGKLDSDIRFLVVGTPPEVADSSAMANENVEAQVAGIGDYKEDAIQLGITVIPAWKLQAYLRTIDDSLTTPLGSAVRGDDFGVESRIRRRQMTNDISEMYKKQKDGFQRGNEIKP
ncbi:MAG: hypothetical protein AAF958_19740 [Planctomycetota bacterium]